MYILRSASQNALPAQGISEKWDIMLKSVILEKRFSNFGQMSPNHFDNCSSTGSMVYVTLTSFQRSNFPERYSNLNQRSHSSYLTIQ